MFSANHFLPPFSFLSSFYLPHLNLSFLPHPTPNLPSSLS
ncbi:hypothetical protein LINPERHAP1_LOCUS16213 [Linum perenne]